MQIKAAHRCKSSQLNFRKSLQLHFCKSSRKLTVWELRRPPFLCVLINACLARQWLYCSYDRRTHSINFLTSSETYWYRGSKLGLIVRTAECMQFIQPGPKPYYTNSDCLSSQLLCVIRKMPRFRQTFSKGVTILTNFASGLERKGLGLWTILRVVATPVPASQSNPIQTILQNMPYRTEISCASDTSKKGKDVECCYWQGLAIKFSLETPG